MKQSFKELSNESVLKQIVIGGIIYFNKSKEDRIPISIKGHRKSMCRAVYDYIKNISEDEFEDLLEKVRTEHEYVKSSIMSKYLLKAKFSSDPQRQKETLVRIKYPQIFELENQYNQSIYKIVSNLKINQKKTLDEISSILELPTFVIELFIKYLTKDKRFFVKSLPEKEIADFLFDNSIMYEYEPKRIYYENNRYFVPDFYLPKYDVYIEYFGFFGEEYKKKIIMKLKVYENQKLNFIYLYRRHIKNLKKKILRKIKHTR